MQRTRRTTTPLVMRAVLAALLAYAVLANVPVAEAVSARGNLAVTVSPNSVYQIATYRIGLFATSKKEADVVGYTLTLPADTDVTNASSPGVGDTIVKSIPTRTVTVTFGTPINSQTERTFAVQLDGIVNPSTGGTYTIAAVTFAFADGTAQTVALGTSGTYTLVPAPYISMTITTPDTGQTVHFGAIDPGITTAGKSVTVAVNSSAAYTITRAVGGDATLLGLTVSGTANGAGAAGSATYSDLYTLTPPWSTDPELPLTATVTYTVTQ